VHYHERDCYDVTYFSLTTTIEIMIVRLLSEGKRSHPEPGKEGVVKRLKF